MIIRFVDTEANVTYLRVIDNHSHADITDMCNTYYKSIGQKEVDSLSVVEWAIRKQLMILLTDVEVEELEKEGSLKKV